MPAKPAKKVKEETPEPKKKVETPKSTPKKKPKEPVVFHRLSNTGDAAVPIDVNFEGTVTQAKPNKAGGYTHTIKLDASAAFSLVNTFVFTEGPNQGRQAIILQPAKAFPFLKLAKEIQFRIFEFYFAKMGVVGMPIAFDGKRQNKEMYAKTYANGSKNRVALLAVNKEIHADAVQVLYANTLKLESTTTLLEFLSLLEPSTRSRLKSICIQTFIKTNSRNAMHFLAEARNLKSLTIESGVFSGADPMKAARQFHTEAYRFLESAGANKGDKAAGVDVVKFGKQALTFQDNKKARRPWPQKLVDEFKDELRNILK